jgi:hypothetical protein
MPTSVLAVLKIVFLLGLYLFIARVVRAVWVEIYAERRSLAESIPSGAGPAEVKKKAEAKVKAAPVDRKERKAEKKILNYTLRTVEPPAARGESYPVAIEMTIGRAEGCAIPISDTFASQLHARVFKRGNEVFVEDLGSTNGTFVNRKRIGGPVALRPKDRIQIGDTVLELQK